MVESLLNVLVLQVVLQVLRGGNNNNKEWRYRDGMGAKGETLGAMPR